MKNTKWRSRKLWVAVGTVGFVVLTDVLGVNIDSDTYWSVVTLAATYIVGQSAVDVQKNKK